MLSISRISIYRQTDNKRRIELAKIVLILVSRPVHAVPNRASASSLPLPPLWTQGYAPWVLTVPTLSPTSAWRDVNPRFLAEDSLCECMGSSMCIGSCSGSSAGGAKPAKRLALTSPELSTRRGRREQSYLSFFLDNVNGSTCQEEPESVVAISHDQSRQ